MLEQYIIESVKYIKHLFENKLIPCYFLYGSSNLNLLENYSMELVDELENNYGTSLKGIVRHFSIRMPYISSSDEKKAFVEKFTESISIAQECYNEYRGIVIIELDDSWLDYGLNTYFSCLNDLFCNHRKNFYIVLARAKDKSSVIDDVETALKEFSILIEAKPHFFELQYYADMFERIAADMGYSITDDAGLLIRQYIFDSAEFTDNLEQLVIQTIFQIDIAKKSINGGTVIEVDDLRSLPETSARESDKLKIGFTPDYLS